MNQLEALYAAQIVQDAARAKTREERLAYGARMRAAMKAAVAAGEPPTGYRAEWLQQNAQQLLELAGIMAQEFNAQHPDDYISGLDLLDLLTTSISQLKSNLDQVIATHKSGAQS